MDRTAHPEAFTSAHEAIEPLPENIIGVLLTLSAENAAINTLLKKINLDAQSVNTRRRYLPMVNKAIAAHIETQRRVLLPALLTPEILDTLTTNEQHLSDDICSVATQPLQRWQAAQRVVLRKLELVKRTPATKFSWRGNFDSLAAAVEQCIEEEQQVVFPIAARLLTHLKLLSLDIRYTRELNSVMSKLAIS